MNNYWSKEEKEYIRTIVAGRSYKEITELMNKEFGNKFIEKQIKNAINRYKLNTGRTGRFEKGSIPYNKGKKGLSRANKTSFKKGILPKNHKPVGSERITIDGYVMIKVKEPGVWRLKHRVLWENEYGSIPKGYNLIFADGNKLNVKISNLILTSRREMLEMNREKFISSDPEVTRTGKLIVQLKIKISDLNKKGNRK